MTVAIRPDYRAFLARCPRDIRPQTAHIESLPLPKQRVPRVESWVNDVAVLLGATSFAKPAARARNDHYFWDKRLSPYAYVVGRTYEDDPILQVVRGKLAGQILLFNHELYYGRFDQLAKLVGGERPAPEFWKLAQPVLAKNGYRSGTPTPDQVLAVLLNEKLEGAERICDSFDELYAAVHLLCERRPKPRAKSRGHKVTLTEIKIGDSSFGDTKMACADAVAYVAPCGSNLVALRPGRVPLAMAQIENVHALAASGSRLYMVHSAEDADALLAVSSDGGRHFRTIAPGGAISDLAADEHGVNALLDRRLVHFPRTGRARPAVAAGRCNRLGAESPAGRIAFASDELRLLRPNMRTTAIELPPKVRDVEDVVITRTGTILVMTFGSGVLRSTDHGARWQTVPHTTDHAWKCGVQLPSDDIVIGGGALLVSRDDGQSFAALTAKFQGLVECVAELGDELILAASEHVYSVRKADVLPNSKAASSRARGIQPIKAKPPGPPLQPLSSYVALIRERVWQIQPYDKTKLYVASVRNGAVRVLENGSQVVYSKKLSRELPGRFRVHSGWLVYETSPREVEREKRRAAKQAAEWGTGRTLPGVVRPL